MHHTCEGGLPLWSFITCMTDMLDSSRTTRIHVPEVSAAVFQTNVYAGEIKTERDVENKMRKSSCQAWTGETEGIYERLTSRVKLSVCSSHLRTGKGKLDALLWRFRV